jgi:hypothetical protein
MSSVTDIARRRADRLRVMNAIYEAAEGSRMSHVSGGWLLEHLELPDEELGDLNLDKVREIVGEFEAQAASLPLPDGDARQLRADMAAVKVQIGLPTPDHYTIAGHLQSARVILEHATGAAAAGLLDLLRNTHI